MGNVFQGGDKFLMPIFLDGPGSKDAVKKSFTSKVALHFNNFPKAPGRN